jgi:YD repeat-containing protein
VYDVYGNIQEMQKTNDVKEVYLWGYSNMYPVAKVVGSTYTTVSSIAQQYLIDGAVSNDASMRSVLNNLRANLPNAFVTTYTYAPLVGMTSQTDPAGRTTYYEYDGLGRLSLIRDKDQNSIKKFDYQYQASSSIITPPTIFSNTLQSGSFTKNNCGTGYAGSSVVYTVPANTYTSAISQADADNKAQADKNANGQNYANTYGTCTSTSTPCTISMYSGYSSPTNSVNNNGTTVSGYIVFYPTSSTMNAGSMYQIATIGTGCRPSGVRTFSTYAGGRNWTITVYPGGMIYAQIAYGSSPLGTYSTVSINISYSL